MNESNNTAPPKDTDFHIAITRIALPGKEKIFEVALREFAAESLEFPGTTGVHIIRPPEGSSSREFGILRSFLDKAHADEFYDSEIFHHWMAKTAGLTEAESIKRELHGLECFFRQPASSGPPRWKMALVTWVGVFPTVVFWIAALNEFEISFGMVGRIGMATVLTVITLTWAVMPLLVRALSRWLER
ncbi:MAG: antibiotic biosynthesis monooxygenase [Pseudomonadota bacterium]